MNDCFPEWLKRRTAQRIGPTIEYPIPVPVYQRQSAIISNDNICSPSGNISDSFFKSFASRILAAQCPTTIIKICSRDVYDTILVSAFDNNVVVAGNRQATIFLSFKRPGRILTEPFSQANPEVAICTATAFTVADVSSYPMVTAGPEFFQLATANSLIYSNLVVTTPKTNRPFYVWFADSIQGTPTTAANFKITWYSRNR